MPAQETINPSAMVPSYPVVERYRYLWVWPGDLTRADPDLIPDMHQMDDPEWAGDGLTIEAPCNYQLILDNLMDLTHETYVHQGSIGQAELMEAPIETHVDGDCVVVSRWMPDIDAPPFWRNALKKDGPVHRWQVCHFLAPSNVQSGCEQGQKSGISAGSAFSASPTQTQTKRWRSWVG